MALLNIGEDPWLLEHESCEKLYRDIMEQLSLRQRETRSSENYARLSASLRMRLKQYNNEVSQLDLKLREATKIRSITADESERRIRQIELLKSKGFKMQKLFEDQTVNANTDRSHLVGPDWASSSRDHIQIDPKPRSIDELRDDQRNLLREQESGLENLSKIIARQKNIAETINNEVDLHNEIIEDLGDHIDRTDMRIRNETQNVTVIDTKDKTCIYWVIIILLFISIITVSAI